MLISVNRRNQSISLKFKVSYTIISELMLETNDKNNVKCPVRERIQYNKTSVKLFPKNVN